VVERERLIGDGTTRPSASERPSLPIDVAELEGAVTPGADVLDAPDAGIAAIRGSGMRTAGYAAGVLLMLAAAPLLVRHLGTVEFGRYTVVVSLIALVAGLTEGGLTAIGLREHALREGADRELLMRNLLGVRLTLTSLGVGLALLFALAAGYDETLVLGTLVAGLGLIVLSMQNLLGVPLQATLRFGWVTGAELLRIAIQVALIIGGVVVGASTLWFLGVTVPAGLIAIVPVLYLVRNMVPLRPAFHPSRWWELLRDTLPYAAAVAVSVAYFRITVIIMSLIATETATGYFSASYRVIEVLVAIPSLVISAIFPVLSRAARDNRERFVYVTRRTFEVSVIFGIWTVLSIAIGAGFIIDVIAGEDFGPAEDVLRIQAFAIAATFVATACGFTLLSLRRHKALLLPNLLALGLTAALSFALIPPYDEQGAAVATVAAEVTLAIAMAVLTLRSASGLRLPLEILPFCLAAAGLSACVLLVPGIHDAIQVVVATIIYFGLLATLGRIPSELKDALVGWRRALRGTG
jgi:O-antigen/teichoic acid export membrane protein